jgi:pimeloyl-ACP methyl ester carboxylesterase
MPFASAADGTRLYFETHGAGEPLLLISGQASDSSAWDYVRDDFAAAHRVIVFDHRGTGRSDKPQEPEYSTRGFAQDAIAILDHLDVPRAHAYGISMGGRVCQWLGIEHAARIGALVLGCTTPGNAHGVAREQEVNAAMASGNVGQLFDLMVSPAWAAAHPDAMPNLFTTIKNPIPRYAAQLHYRASEAHDAWELLPTIAAPTLVIHGSDDRINPSGNAQRLAERIPNATIAIVDGGRHAFHFEFREQASRRVLDFLRANRLDRP